MAKRFSLPAYKDIDSEGLTGGVRTQDSSTLAHRTYFPSPGATQAEWIGGGIYLLEKNAMDELIQENVRLRRDINALTEKVSELITLLCEDYANRAENLIVLREIPRDQAKKEIAKLFQKSGSLYYSDIAEQLRLDLELVVDLCSELEKEGQIRLKQ